MTNQFIGNPDFQHWLTDQGFKLCCNGLADQGNLCNWIAYRYSGIPTRLCECNDTKPKMQLVIKPYEVRIDNTIHRSIEVEICGEYAGTWFKLMAYALSFDDLQDKLPEIEKSLISAWNALSNEIKNL